MGNKRYTNGFAVTLHHDLIDIPLKWKKPRTIFVNSMSDLFHEKVPVAFIKAVFRTMEDANWHTFQILTKRSERLVELAPKLSWPSNVWMGVTVESEKYISRISDIAKVPAAIKYLSIEPLLTAIPKLALNNIDWVIVGGESGPGSRVMEAEWVRSIRDQCQKAKVPFFFKQWGGVNKSKTGKILDGRIWQNYPTK
jgi:protein gp37